MARYPFIGPAYTLASVAADCQELMNWYLEADETGKGRSPVYLKRTPGITLFSDLSAVGSPIRGIWAGENRLFAVAGASFVEIFSDGSYENRSALSGATTVGNDGNPVSILPNGTQVLIVSAGNVYCDSGLGPVLVAFNPGSGTVSTAGTAVTWLSGSQFFNLSAGQYIVINSVVYQIASVTDETDLVLYTSAGSQSNVSWTGFGLNGSVDMVEFIGPGYTLVNLISGDPFPPNLAGANIVIAFTTYTVTAVLSPTQLKIPATPGIFDTKYGANVPISAFQGTYIDSYFVVAQPNSNIFYISANFDGTTWDAADFAEKEGYPDNISALRADHEQLWVMGDEESAEVWLDTGAALFPFQRSASQTIHYGCFATWSCVRFGNGIAWVGGDEERGGPMVFYAEGSGPNIISTFAIQQAWSLYSVFSDAVAYSTIEDGHEILIISFPTANATWGYDRTASAQLGIPCWHQRGWWNGASNDRTRGAFYAAVRLATVGKSPNVQPFQSYVGDWQSGKVYVIAAAITNDNGVLIHRVRTSPHGAGVDNLRVFTSRFELLIDLGPGADAIFPVLSYSVDGGHNFINPQTRTVSAGVTNQFQCRFIWRRQGNARDRVYQLAMDDDTPFTVIDAYFEASQGTA